MKKVFCSISVLLIASAILFAFKTSLNTLPIGSKLPNADIKLKDISYKEISLNDAKKKNGLLVMFSCNTCPYVVKSQERTNAVCEYALQNNIGLVLLNSNETQRSAEASYEAMQLY